jgi:hypothetical protein
MDFLNSIFSTPAPPAHPDSPSLTFPTLSEAYEELQRDFASFVANHDVTDPLFTALGLLHLGLLVLILATRSNISIQAGFFAICLGVARSGEILNQLGSEHWETLGASRDYFDPNGAFISLVLLAPLLCLAGLILFNFFVHLTSLAATVKAAQIKQERRKKKKKN